MFIRYFVVFLLFGASMQSQTTVAVHDSSMLRGTHEIPLYASLNLSQGDSVRADIQFNPQLLDITGISSPQVAIIQAQFSVENQSVSSAILHLKFVSAGITITNAVLLQLHVDLLAGPDSTTVLVPNFLSRNGQAISNVKFQSGTLHYLDDVPISPVDIEYLGDAYPHPGNDQRFPYHIIQKCAPRFTIFDIAGRQLIDQTIAEQDAGTYTLHFTNAAYPFLCDAVYFVRMLTPLGVYVVPFEVIH